MSTIIIGCERSGTNMALEILRGNPFYETDPHIENKELCKGNKEFQDNYLTKCHPIYFCYEQLKNLLTINSNLVH